MTKLTHDLIRIVAALSITGVIACAAEDDGDTNDPSVATTVSTTMTTAPETDTNDETTDDPSTTMTTDNPSTTMTTDDPSTTMSTTMTMDTGDECTAEDDCIMDADCPGGGSCIGCLCIGGEETGTTECGTNVGTMNMACDDCSHENCCAEVQGCFGDETVTENTPCLDLNNCIATNCTDAGTVEAIQACIEMNCPELAGEFNTWAAFIGCVGMNCQAECAG